MENKKIEDFKPYIPADKVLPEITVLSVIIGIFVAIIFGASNAYLGLKVGMTISASIPASVISMAIIRGIMHKNSILENNIVQTLGSIGVSIASAIIFVVPAMYMWSEEWNTPQPGVVKLFLISTIGGLLGIVFMVPLRKALIVKEHQTLPYPEGTACAEVLLAGESKGNSAAPVFKGLGLAAGYKFVSDGMGIFPNTIGIETNKLGLPGGGIAANILPALVGVGYICGFRVSSILLSGSALGWLVIMPLVAFFAGNATIYPGTSPINQMTSYELWSNYLRYIGAGAVAMGGLMSLAKSTPLIFDTFKKTFKDMGQKNSKIRTDTDISIVTMLIIVIVSFVLILSLPILNINLTGTILIMVLGFMFATVSSRAVGLVGVSNNPTSGMIIASLLIVSFVLKQTGVVGREGIMMTVVIGAIICVIISVAGDTSQDLKTGYIVGATPRKQQISEVIGVIAIALVIGFIMYLFNTAWGFGNLNLPAPQASLIKIIIEGVMSGNLPWTLFIIGAVIAVIVEILRLPTLAFAVGLYLPIEINMGVFIGGITRAIFDKKIKNKNVETKGILYCSGLIAGEGIVGVLLASFAIVPLSGGTLASFINVSNIFNLGSIGTVIGLGIIIFTIFWFSRTKKELNNEKKETK